MCRDCVRQAQAGQHGCHSHHEDSVRQQNDCIRPTHSFHIHQTMPHSSSNDFPQNQRHEASIARDTAHTLDCPRHGRGVFRGYNTRSKAPACTRHHDSCPRHRHEHPCIHARPRPQLPDSSEYEGYESYTSQTKVRNECAIHPPKMEHYDQNYSGDTSKYTHLHITSPVSGTFPRTTVHTSRTNGGGIKIKCVRFSDEETSRTVSSLYSTFGSSSYADHLCHASQQYARPPPSRILRESRHCSREVWGPPLPETYSRRYEASLRSGH